MGFSEPIDAPMQRHPGSKIERKPGWQRALDEIAHQGTESIGFPLSGQKDVGKKIHSARACSMSPAKASGAVVGA